jgi:hypothetical protein
MRWADHRGALRAARTLLLALVLTGASACRNAIAEVAATDKKEQTKPKIIFAPEVEAKFTEFVNKVGQAKRRLWTLRMKWEIEEVAKVTGLSDEGRKALGAAAEQAADLCMEGWSAKFSDFWRQQYSQQPDQILEMLDQLLAQADNYAKSDFVADYVRPYEHTAWAEALQRTLTAEQIAAWDKSQVERKRVLGTQIGDFLKPSVERTREQFFQAILAKGTDIRVTLALPKERAEMLDALAKSAADKTADDWRIRAEKMLFNADEDQRRQIIKSGQFYLAPDEKELPQQQATWKDGVAKLLTAGERDRLQAAQEEQRARRIRVMGQIMIAELDQRIAFNARQREQLQPVTERLVKDQASLFPDDGFNNYVNFTSQSFYAAGSKATEEELKPILDTLQWKRWQEVCMPKKNRATPAAAKSKPGVDAKQPPQNQEPEDLEHRISDYLHEKTTNERQRMLAAMTVKVEDVARATGLTGDAINRLQTAARGATEETLVGWKSNTEQTLRAQVRDATPQNVMQRLASMENYYSQRDGGVIADKQAVWDKTVKAELTAEQRAAWEKEVEERKVYRDKAIISTAMAEFDRKNTLSAEQWEKLEPIINGIVKDYSSEFANFFSSSNSWYLQSYSMLIPFAGAPEKDLKAILSKEQWDRWTGSNEFANSTNYWQNIQRNHAQRVKAPK